MPYATIALAAYGIGSSIYKEQQAKKAIQRLKKVKPAFRTAEDIQSEAETKITSGYTPEEKADFFASMTRANNASYRRATDTNPNLAPQIQAGINYGNVGAISNFAARDAQLRRQRIQDYISLTRGQSNTQTQADLASKREQEIAYGNAKNQANAELYNSIAMAGYGITTAAKQAGGGTNTATGNTFWGDAPMQSYGQPQPGSDAWARNLYGNPTGYQPSQQPIMTNYGYQYPMARGNMLQNSQYGYYNMPPIRNRYSTYGWMTNPNQYSPY